mmetsp:Transcript_13819/g.37348  ORF Transcript_13819/g.37348 Transcript_13819/m.37348 type:complete len:252 (-) Transcript_13819:743-1498(-)
MVACITVPTMLEIGLHTPHLHHLQHRQQNSHLLCPAFMQGHLLWFMLLFHTRPHALNHATAPCKALCTVPSHCSMQGLSLLCPASMRGHGQRISSALSLKYLNGMYSHHLKHLQCNAHLLCHALYQLSHLFQAGMLTTGNSDFLAELRHSSRQDLLGQHGASDLIAQHFMLKLDDSRSDLAQKWVVRPLVRPCHSLAIRACNARRGTLCMAVGGDVVCQLGGRYMRGGRRLERRAGAGRGWLLHRGQVQRL